MNHYEQKQADRKERYEEKARDLRAKASAMHDSGIEALRQIPFGQPILVGHHSERSDRAYRGRAIGKIDRSFEMSNKAAYYADKAESVGTGGISSDDPEAIIKLEAKLKTLEGLQSRMREANAVARANLQPQPYAKYQLTNNSAVIRSTKARIEELRAKANIVARPTISNEKFSMREDLDENRIMFFFPGKPDEATRDILKSRGFKWSPTRSAWVRMLNGSGRFAADQVIAVLNK